MLQKNLIGFLIFLASVNFLFPFRFIYRQIWICQHSSHRKRKSGSVRNTNCRAKFDVLIKKVNANTIKNDPFLKENPLLAGPLLLFNVSDNIFKN